MTPWHALILIACLAMPYLCGASPICSNPQSFGEVARLAQLIAAGILGNAMGRHQMAKPKKAKATKTTN